MDLECNGYFALIVLQVANAVYFCGGLTILVFGLIGLCDPATTVSLLTYNPDILALSNILYLPGIVYAPAVEMTCAGSLATVLSFVGILAPYKRRKSLFYVYLFANMVFLYWNVGLLMYSLITPYRLQSNVVYNMNLTLTEYFNPVSLGPNNLVTLPSDEHAQAWVEMQFQQVCCGVNDYRDYQTFTWNNTFAGISGVAQVPPSCCIQQLPYVVTNNTLTFVNLTECLTNPPLYTNSRGCVGYVMTIFRQYNFIYGVIGTALSALQGFIVVSTTRLMLQEFDKRIETPVKF